MTRRHLLILLCGLLLGAAAFLLGDRLSPGEWRLIQREYNRRLGAVARPTVAIGVRATASPRPDRAEERCVTCHLGTVLPDAFDAAPLRRHPPIGCRLRPSDIGCTPCHRGDALRLSAGGAHAVGRPAQLLDWRVTDRRAALEPACAGCHLGRSSGVLLYERAVVPRVAAGMELFLSQGCFACHRVDGVFVASDHGPALSEIGWSRSRAELARALAQPQRRSDASPMPPLVASAEETEQLLSFLQAQVGVRRELGSSASAVLEAGRRRVLADHFSSDYPADANPAAGALWARRVGCGGCHRLAAGEAGVPDLTRVGWYMSSTELSDVLRDPRRRVAASLMPRLEMPEPVVGGIVQHLSVQRHPLPSAPCDVFGELCARCHGPRRDARGVVLSRRPPSLGDRVSPPAFLEAVSKGRRGTAMAPWGGVLGGDFIRGLRACAGGT
jgi:mono/diheme cytochrome c family protein